VSQSKR